MAKLVACFVIWSCLWHAVSAQSPMDSLFRPYRIKYPNKLPYNTSSTKTDSPPQIISEPVNHNNQAVNALLDSIFQANKQLKYADGYRIVVYTGSDREQVNKIKEKVYRALGGDVNVYVIYKQPTFQIKVGDYLERLQAQVASKKLQEVIANPLVITEQVNLFRTEENRQ